MDYQTRVEFLHDFKREAVRIQSLIQHRSIHKKRYLFKANS